MPEALSADGGKLSAKDKTGLGYTGEKVERHGLKRAATNDNRTRRDIRITTVYDNPNETDPSESANRRCELTQNKNRSRHIGNVFVKP
jgi:hypothetical protein